MATNAFNTVYMAVRHLPIEQQRGIAHTILNVRRRAKYNNMPLLVEVAKTRRSGNRYAADRYLTAITAHAARCGWQHFVQ